MIVLTTQAKSFKESDTEKHAIFKRLVRHAIQHDYFCMFDKLQQVPFVAKTFKYSSIGAAGGSTSKEYTGEIKMTVDFTNLQADFVEACLQAMCLL